MSSSTALTFHPRSLQDRKSKSIYIRPLTFADLPAALELESTSFPEHERCSYAKFHYRLTVCPELCHGLFTLSKPHPDTPKNANPDWKPKEVLIGMVVGTKSDAETITDRSMHIPAYLLARFDPEAAVSAPVSAPTPPKHTQQFTPTPAKGEESEGHTELGQTICIHSLCISPAHQKMGYAAVLMKDYIARMRDAGCAKRLALIAHDGLVEMYTKLGFRSLGKSGVEFAGGDWADCIYVFGEEAKRR